jgi:hypothetical protein
MKIPESKEFSKESKKLPSFEFTIFFGQHLLEEDIPQDFIEAFKECDVYIIELMGEDTDIEELNKLSRGEIDPNSTEISHHPNPFMRKLVRLIYNSGKKIITIDLPKKHLISQRIQELSRQEKIILFEGYPFETLIDKWRELLSIISVEDMLREAYMLNRLDEELRNLMNDPRFSKKERIKILMYLGAFHTGFYHVLKERFPGSIFRKFSVMPLVYPYYLEVSRRIYFGKEIDDELVSKSLLEELLFYSAVGLAKNPRKLLIPSKSIKDSYSFHLLLRKLVEKFSYEEIKEFFDEVGELIRRGEEIKNIYLFVSRNFLNKLESKGIKDENFEKFYEIYKNLMNN